MADMLNLTNTIPTKYGLKRSKGEKITNGKTDELQTRVAKLI